MKSQASSNVEDGHRRGGQGQREIRKCYSAGFNGGGRVLKPRNTDSLWNLEEARDRFSPQVSRRQSVLLTPRFNSEAHSGLVTSRTVR